MRISLITPAPPVVSRPSWWYLWWYLPGTNRRKPFIINALRAQFDSSYRNRTANYCLRGTYKMMFHESPIDVFEARFTPHFATFVAKSQITDPFVVKPPRYYARAIIVTINVFSV